MNRTRRPGDQAPPPRPTHRNDHIKTAATHIKDTAGKLFFVHDGSPEKNTLSVDGKRLELLSYADARKAKDYAVSRLKQRTASILEHPVDESGEYYTQPVPEPEGLELDDAGRFRESPNTPPDSFVPPTASLPDPQLEAARQKAVAAVRPVAAQAQARANAVKPAAKTDPQRAPGWEPAPKKQQPATGKAPGWEPPPTGVSAGLGGVKHVAQVDNNKQAPRAAGWIKQDAARARPSVALDDPNAPDAAEEGDSDMSDLIINPDLESDVKVETERMVASAKKAWESLAPQEQEQIKAQVIRVATDGEREKMYAAMDPEQVGTFEVLEAAYHLLFGLPPHKAAPANAEAKAP